MDEQQKLMNWILKVAVSVLAAVIGIVVVVMCVGLFLPNEQIDNAKIFEMINPAFNTIIGAFVGLLGGLSISKGEKKEEPPAPPPPPPAPVEEPPPAPVAVEVTSLCCCCCGDEIVDDIDVVDEIPERQHSARLSDRTTAQLLRPRLSRKFVHPQDRRAIAVVPLHLLHRFVVRV